MMRSQLVKSVRFSPLMLGPILILVGCATAHNEPRSNSKQLDAGRKPQVFFLGSGNAVTKVHPKGASVQILSDARKDRKGHVFVAKLTIPANGKVPAHRDPSDEYVYVLSGSGVMTVGESKKGVKISKGDTVLIEAGAEIWFQAGDQPVEVLQVFDPSGPEKKYDSWKQVPAAGKGMSN